MDSEATPAARIIAKKTRTRGRRRPPEFGRVPKALYIVCSTASNPHANGTIELFTTRQKAERACRWGDQRLVVFVPRTPASSQPLDVERIRQRAADLRRVSRNLTMAEQRATVVSPSLLCAVVDDLDDLLLALTTR